MTENRGSNIIILVTYYSDSDDGTSFQTDRKSVLSDRSVKEMKRSTYTESFSDSDRSYDEQDRPPSKQSVKYTPSVMSRATGADTNRKMAFINIQLEMSTLEMRRSSGKKA